MVTTTTRLALTKPAGTDVVDVDVLNANADKLDAAAGATICTSTTRPSSPYAGQIIYETDTKLTWKYASGGWKLDTGIQPVVASSAARDAIFSSPAVGDSVWRSDLGYSETYYAAAGSPARPAGWYSGREGGLVPITPTSVVAGGGTATVSANGLVTIGSLCSSLLLENVFPINSGFTKFRVVIRYTTYTVAAQQDYMKLASGTTPDGGSTTFTRGVTQSGSSAPAAHYTASSVGGFYLLNQAGHSACVIDVFAPNVSGQTTTATWISEGYGPADAYFGAAGMNGNTAAFNGLQLTSTGTFAGNVQVFGYRD